ncbi:MAG: rhodanese-like domain-containing protein [Dehalococcoidales bacterium]
MKRNPKTLIILLLSMSLLGGAVLAGGCLDTKQQPAQITKDITPQEAFALIQENQTNPNFAIIDVRTPEEFAGGHIENAINIDYYSDTFRGELNQLDRNNTYLIYCRSGGRSGSALAIMKELNFKEVYNMTGGITQWKVEGLPTIQKTAAEAETPNQESSVSEYLNQLVKELEKEEVKAITPEEAYALMQSNPGYVIIDTRTPEAFANEHIEGAINIDYQSENFRDKLNQLDKSNATFAYYTPYGCAPCGGTNDTLKEALDIFQIFKGLQFKEAYYINGGIIAWKLKWFPTTE